MTGNTCTTLHLLVAQGRHWCAFPLRADRNLAGHVGDTFALTRCHQFCLL